jgi:hypothetical protein
MEVAMIRFISKVKAGLLILLAVLSILIGSSTLFGKKSYADVPTWAHTECSLDHILCYGRGPFLCCPTQPQ